MSDTLYMQVDKSVEVHHPHVYLQDIVRLSCTNSKVLNRLRVLPVANLTPDQKGRYVMNVLDLIEEIQKKETNLDISPIGETDFILVYEPPRHIHRLWEWGKAAALCVVSFFGTAFGIMSFNNDVSIKDLFSQIYYQVTGEMTNGFTTLEIAYSVGIGLGILFFFNHFGRMKLNSDPTPMQVKMRLYEDDVNTTLTKQAARGEES